MDQRSAGEIGVSDTVHTRGDGALPAEELAPGTVVGGYEIEGLAGRGGMGVVYRARDLQLGRTVALKLIGGERAADPDRRALFIRESLTAASIEHPNVLPLYRAGEDDGRLFIAMRFVEGASLDDLIAAAPGGLPPGRAARVVARAADALDAAHSRRLVHRDVKPGNILIADPDGEEHVYLSDFGLTTGGDAIRAGEGWTGTLAYLSPEQIRGEPLDPRTDVYGLGCVLYHALTGRPPFTGDEESVLDAHLTARPPIPSEAVPGLPPALDQVVARAMAKRREDRHATAGELGRAALAARYDVALLVAPDDTAAAAALAAGLQASEVLPLVTVAGEPGAAEGVRASGACAVLVGRGGLGDWAREGLAAASAVAAHDRAFRLVLVLLPGAPDPGDPGLAYLADNPWVDLRGGASDALAATDLARALRGADVPAGLPTDEGVAPYRGLEAFREDDTALYFGREQDVARVLERLRTSRFVAVVGPSGSGKSSLVQAGVLPVLRREGAASADWRILDMVPGARPLASLAAHLAHLAGAGAPSPADLGADERTLDVATARALDGRPADERVLLVVDQLEEAFTLCSDEGERAAFLDNLVYAATIPGGRTVVVATMRADFYHRLAEHPTLRGLVASQQVLLGPLDARNLRRAIEEPARRCGLELEPGLTRRILTDVAGRPGTLPLLEYLLLELWRRRRDRTLTLEAYGASGGVEGALARRANEVYGGMDPEHQAIARRVLLRLTQPGEGTEDTRRRATRAELVTDPGEQAEVDDVVESLAEARLVTTGSDDATGEPVVEVTHEALIRGWPELRGWLDEDRDRLRAERRLADAAAEWDRGGRDEGALYRGARLLWWSERDTSTLNRMERDFLTASRARAEGDRAARRRRVRIAIAGLSVALAAIAAVAVFALIQRSDATDQRDVAQSRELAGSALLQLPTDPERSVLLAEEAYEVADTPQAEEVLRQATFESRIRAAFRGHDGDVRTVAFSPDGATILSGGDDGTLQLWNPQTGDTRVVATGQGAIADVAVAADGRVATAGEDGTIRIWAADDGRRLLTLSGHEGGVAGVAFVPGQNALASAGSDGTVRLWTLPQGRPRVLGSHAGGASAVAVSPDGRRVASGGQDKRVKVWARDGTPIANFVGSGSDAVSQVSFSPDGRRVAGATGNAYARVWTLGGDPTPLVVRASQVYGAGSVAFSPDGRRIVTSGGDGTVRVWDAQGKSIAVLRGHEEQVRDAVFSPDGRFVASVGEDGTVRVWAWAAGQPTARAVVSTFPWDGGIQFSRDGRTALAVSGNGTLSAWDTRSSRLDPRVGGEVPEDFVWTAAVSPDGTLLGRALADGTVEVLPTSGTGEPTLLRGHKGEVWGIDFAGDDRTVATAGGDGTLRIWNLETGRAAVLRGQDRTLLAVDLSDDGRTAVTGAEDGTVHVWDVPSGTQTAQLKGHEGAVNDVELSPDGTRVVTSGSDRTVRVWSPATGDAVVLQGHESSVLSATFSRDGSRVLSTADDALRVWDWANGTTVLRIPSSTREFYRADLSPDASRIVAEDLEGRLAVYACETCGSVGDVRALAGQRVTRDLTAAERESFGVDDGR